MALAFLPLCFLLSYMTGDDSITEEQIKLSSGQQSSGSSTFPHRRLTAGMSYVSKCFAYFHHGCPKKIPAQLILVDDKEAEARLESFCASF